MFRAGRTTNLIVDTVDGKWRRGLIAAAREYRRAFKFGFSAAEVAEQVANVRTAARNEAASAATRSNVALLGAVFALLRDDIVPATPQGSLERLEAFIPEITPERVLAALKREAVPLTRPLLRFQGRRQPGGGEAAVRAAWDEAERRSLGREAPRPAAPSPMPTSAQPAQWPPTRASRRSASARCASPTACGSTSSAPRSTRSASSSSSASTAATCSTPGPIRWRREMASMLPVGGLGKHSQDELQSILAGRTVGYGFASTPETFVSVGPDHAARPRAAVAAARGADHRSRLPAGGRSAVPAQHQQLLRPAARDAGLRAGEQPWRHPVGRRPALHAAEGRGLPQADLRQAQGRIWPTGSPRGAIEIGMVGDVDEDAGDRPGRQDLRRAAPREAEFQPYPEQRERPFTANRAPRMIRHTGPAGPGPAAADLADPRRQRPGGSHRARMLERVVRIELTETLREKLGKAYSPSASSVPSQVWRGYGTFALAASVDVAEVPATRAAIAETIAGLRDAPVSDDIFQRARQPMVEAYDNALKNNRGWLTLVDRAQTEADRIDRFVKGKERLLALTAGGHPGAGAALPRTDRSGRSAGPARRRRRAGPALNLVLAPAKSLQREETVETGASALAPRPNGALTIP